MVMAAVPGNRYKLIKLLSETLQIQTWQGLNTAAQRACVVKTAAEAADIDSINAILSTSFKCQRGLRTPDIVTCRAKHREQGRVLVEYPLLTPPEWQTLSPSFFWTDYPRSLVRISSIVDLLHSFGLVHGDLKIENFLVRSVGRRTEYVLVDLDFLCPDNSEPGSRVFGTPEHIAPEILANDRVLVQSDSYSLGVSLQRYLDELNRDSSPGNIGRAVDLDSLTALTGNLRTQDFVRRPRYLLGALREHGLLNGHEFESAQKELLSKTLLVRWLKDGRRKVWPAGELRRQVVFQCRVLGVADELLTLLSSAMAVDRRSGDPESLC
jgi:serine/threonine protein kinase